MSSRIALILVLASLCLGAFLRFAGISSLSLWGDEMISLSFATGHAYYPWREETETIYQTDHYRAFHDLAPTYFSQRLISILRTEQQAPFYFFLLNLWLHLFGTSEAALRSLSVLASVVSIAVMYALGRNLVSIHVGVYSALIFAVAPFQIAFAQFARPYALLGCLALLSTYATLRLCQNARSWKWYLVYAVSAILGLYTHYLFIWNLVFHWMLAVFYHRRHWKWLWRWVTLQACVAGAFLLWMPVLFEQIRWNRDAPSLTWFYWLDGAFAWPDVILYLGRDLILLLSVGRIQGLCGSLGSGTACPWDQVFTNIFYIGPVVVLGWSAWQVLTHFRSRCRTDSRSLVAWSLCLLWGLCIFGGPIVVDRLQQSHMIVLHRYFIAASGPLYLAVAIGLGTLSHDRLRTWVLSGLLLFLLAGSGFYLQGFSDTLIYKQGMREVAQHLDRSSHGNDLVLVLNPGPEPKDLAYYLQANLAFARVNLPDRWQVSQDIQAQLHQLTTGRKRVWYLDDRGPEQRGRHITHSWLRTRYREVETREFTNLSLSFFAALDS